jgi:ABC-type branched-subunit amino acid transport system substrate-binding protein
VDDSFGADAVQGAVKGLTAVNKQPLALEKYDRAKPDFGPIMPKIVAADPQAVMFIGSGTAIVDGMKALRATGSRAQMVTLSNNASSGFIKDLGDIAHGVVVSQVFPYERSIASPLVKEALELAKAAKVELTPSILEGYVSAKVLVEGLRRAGPQPTRDKLRRALETFNRFDVGGIEVSFSPGDHTGLDYADLSIVGPDGRFRR